MAQGANGPEGQAGPLDAVLPGGMAKLAEHTGVEKARKDALSLLALAGLAGSFIAFGAAFAALVGAGAAPETGALRMLAGVAFALAYVLAVVGGAELFTTNNLMVMAWAHRRLSTLELLRAWGIVFVGNFLGAAATGAMLILAGVHTGMDGGVGQVMLAQAERLQGLSLVNAFFLGVLGNTLLCLGVWLTYSGRSTTDRILALTPPVAGFYALGLEHAIAVMFYLPVSAFMALFGGDAFWAATELEPVGVGWIDFGAVLAPVTLGNIIGGGVLVALMYWFIYLRPENASSGP